MRRPYIVPYISEEQVECWLETTKDNPIEIIKMITNNEMTSKALHSEIFNNPDWDPTEE